MERFDYNTLPAVMSTLLDEKFDWKGKKGQTIKLAHLYEFGGYSEYAARAASCATWLEYGCTPEGEKRLQKANFCHLRLCPMCNARRARRAATLLSRVMNATEAARPGIQFVFLTLTVRNVEGPDLSDMLSSLTRAWSLLTRNRRFERAIVGWFRAVEITRNAQTGEYHPHIHAILAVEAAYFSRSGGLYIPHAEWVERWQRALKADYAPSVRISATHERGESWRESGGAAKKAWNAASEAAKYPVKDGEYLAQAEVSALGEVNEIAMQVIEDYTLALFKRRMTAFGGLMRECAKAIKAENVEDGDLVHVDEEDIRSELVEYIAEYGFNFGIGNYELLSVRPATRGENAGGTAIAGPARPRGRATTSDDRKRRGVGAPRAQGGARRRTPPRAGTAQVQEEGETWKTVEKNGMS